MQRVILAVVWAICGVSCTSLLSKERPTLGDPVSDVLELPFSACTVNGKTQRPVRSEGCEAPDEELTTCWCMSTQSPVIEEICVSSYFNRSILAWVADVYVEPQIQGRLDTFSPSLRLREGATLEAALSTYTTLPKRDLFIHQLPFIWEAGSPLFTLARFRPRDQVVQADSWTLDFSISVNDQQFSVSCKGDEIVEVQLERKEGVVGGAPHP